MNIIVKQYSMYSPSACIWNAIDKQYDILCVSSEYKLWSHRVDFIQTGGEGAKRRHFP